MATHTLVSGSGMGHVSSATPGTRDSGPPAPRVRASQAWSALKISPVLESVAFLAGGVDGGRPPPGAPCPEHVLGPLMGTFVGPVGGRLPWDAAEELHRRAVVERKVTKEEWFQWRRARFTPHLLEDVTMLAHGGSCLGPDDAVRCTCPEEESSGEPVGNSRQMLVSGPGLGPVPALTPDPSGRSDPWQDTLVLLASAFRGRGSPLAAKHAGAGSPTIRDMRTLGAHLQRLAGAFAGPRRADRISGLGRLQWDPPLCVTHAWRMRDAIGGTDRARRRLLEELSLAVGLSPGSRPAVPAGAGQGIPGTALCL